MPFKLLAHICLSGITSETIIVFHICFDFIIVSLVQNMASSVRVKDEPNPVLRLANRADKMTLSCPLGLPRCLPQENSALFPYNRCRSEWAWSERARQLSNQQKWDYIIGACNYFFLPNARSCGYAQMGDLRCAVVCARNCGYALTETF